jgi:hypothetical protein
MSRKMDVYIFVYDQKTKQINKYYLNSLFEALDLFKRDKYKTECLKVSGCGMDMGFLVVSELSRVLFDDYKILKQEWL